MHDFPAQPPPWTCMDCALHHHAECRVMQESVYSFFWCRCLLVSHHVKVRRFPPSFNTSTQPRCDFFVHDCWEIMQKPPPLFLMFEQKVWDHQTIPLSIVYVKLSQQRFKSSGFLPFFQNGFVKTISTIIYNTLQLMREFLVMFSLLV